MSEGIFAQTYQQIHELDSGARRGHPTARVDVIQLECVVCPRLCAQARMSHGDVCIVTVGNAGNNCGRCRKVVIREMVETGKHA